MTSCWEGRPKWGVMDHGTENEALRETEIRFLTEASRETPHVIRRMYPCRGLPWIASGKTETAPPAETYPGEPRARRSLFRDLLLEARGEVGSVVAGKGPTVLSSSFILMFAWGTPF